MSNNSSGSTKTWGTTIITGIIILVLVIIAVIVIYYVFSIKPKTPFPLSPFDYGDVVQISPAVFSQNNFNDKFASDNQYLTLTVCEGEGCSNCFQPKGREECDEPQHKVCTVTFTGDKSQNNTKWTLNKFVSSPSSDKFEGKFSAEQDFTEFGNRFYLQNLTSQSPTDFSKMLTSMMMKESACVWGGSITFPVTGNNIWEPNDKESFGVPFVAYFLPTNFPDIYYILFPGVSAVIDPNAVRTNDSICSLRPFAQPNETTYNPWDGTIPNDNSLLLNLIDNVSSDNTAIGTDIPSIFLFKVTKV